MSAERLLVLGADDVSALVRGQQAAMMHIVGNAYETHGRGHSVLPHSTFLRFPGGRDRMIALPAYLGGQFEIAGVKWIASFPGNLSLGFERASGLVVLNSTTTGRPRAILEGSVISATRTAASAGLAARVLHGTTAPPSVGFLGCGAINFEVLRFLCHVWPQIEHAVVCDLSGARAASFAARCMAAHERLCVEVVNSWSELAAQATILSIATTAMQPHLDELDPGPLRTILHLSLRDLAPATILTADNVVDDVDHVCRAETSLHLAERSIGHRGFIRCALADVLAGRQPPKRDYDACTIFSPFGLGILDIAVAQFVFEQAVAQGRGTQLAFASEASG